MQKICYVNMNIKREYKNRKAQTGDSTHNSFLMSSYRSYRMSDSGHMSTSSHHIVFPQNILLFYYWSFFLLHISHIMKPFIGV